MANPASEPSVSAAQNHDFAKQTIENEASSGISYFTPAQNPPSGTASDPQPDGKPPPKLFQPLKLRGLTMQNRITVDHGIFHDSRQG